MQAKLIVIRGRATRKEIPLTQLPLEVGRNRDAGLPIAHDHVSRSHCELFERDGKIVVHDKGSANGTFVNDQQISEAVLEHGDRLRIGPLTFQLAYSFGKKKIGSEIVLVDEINLGADPPAAAKPAPKPPAASGAASKAAAAIMPPAAPAKPQTPAAKAPAAKAPAPAAPKAPARIPIGTQITPPSTSASFDPHEEDTPPSGVLSNRREEPAAGAGVPDGFPLDLRKTTPALGDELDEDQDSRAVVNDAAPAHPGSSIVTLSLDDLAEDDSLVIRSPSIPASKSAGANKPPAPSKPAAPPPAAKAPPAKAPAKPAAPPKPAPAAKAAPAAAADEFDFFNSFDEVEEPAAPVVAPRPAAPAKPAPGKKPATPASVPKAADAPKFPDPDEVPAEAATEETVSDDDDPMAFFRSLK